MKRFGLKLLVFVLCALPAQMALGFEYYYTPEFNKIPRLTIVEPLSEGAVAWLASGDFQFRSLQHETNAVLTAAPDLRAASPLAESRSERMGFRAYAAVIDSSASSDRPAGVNYRRAQNRQRHFKQLCRWRPVFPAVRKMLG